MTGTHGVVGGGISKQSTRVGVMDMSCNTSGSSYSSQRLGPGGGVAAALSRDAGYHLDGESLTLKLPGHYWMSE